jgi:hypothetical protein
MLILDGEGLNGRFEKAVAIHCYSKQLWKHHRWIGSGVCPGLWFAISEINGSSVSSSISIINAVFCWKPNACMIPVLGELVKPPVFARVHFHELVQSPFGFIQHVCGAIFSIKAVGKM